MFNILKGVILKIVLTNIFEQFNLENDNMILNFKDKNLVKKWKFSVNLKFYDATSYQDCRMPISREFEAIYFIGEITKLIIEPSIF